MPTPTVINQYRFSDAINRRYWDNKYFEDEFKFQPVTSKVAGGAATGTAGDNNVLFTKFNAFEWNVIGTQTILAPSIDAVGLNFVQDVNSGDGSEFCMGQTALTTASYIIGTSPAFYMEFEWTVGVVGGVNPLIIGFRKAQAFNATLSTYTDFVALGIVGTAGHIQSQTQIGSAGVITTDTTQLAVNVTKFRLKILVDSQGNVTYQFNDSPVTVSVAYKFTTGLTVVPFWRVVESATTTTQASCSYMSIGFQS